MKSLKGLCFVKSWQEEMYVGAWRIVTSIMLLFNSIKVDLDGKSIFIKL